MNKEEIKKLINDPLLKDKITNSTNILMDIYELGFNNGFKLSQSQLDIANEKLDKIKELIEENEVYNGIEYILNPDKVFKTKDILSIIGGNDE
ncbi:MAG TPA: hypothetical protein GX708_23365 [Gallicola sp.]|nr:hypothetical protein [Gallicola sp.]